MQGGNTCRVKLGISPSKNVVVDLIDISDHREFVLDGKISFAISEHQDVKYF